jgi:hypothetical protein
VLHRRLHRTSVNRKKGLRKLTAINCLDTERPEGWLRLSAVHHVRKKTLHNFAAHKILYCGGRTSGRGNLLRYDGGAGAPPRPKTDGDVHLILRCLTTARARPIPHKDNRYLSVDPRVFLSQRCYTGACVTIIILRIKICSRRNSRTMRTDSSTTVCQDQVWMHGLARSLARLPTVLFRIEITRAVRSHTSLYRQQLFAKQGPARRRL